MRKLNATELILISNALFEKAREDRAAADTRAVREASNAFDLASTLRKQADLADDLANEFLCAETGEIK